MRRQGYHNYNEIFTRKDYDFNALAERNTATPGFGKGDFVSYYTELKSSFY